MYYPNTNTKTEFNQKKGYKRDLFEKVWKITPPFLTNRIGPKIVKQFP